MAIVRGLLYRLPIVSSKSSKPPPSSSLPPLSELSAELPSGSGAEKSGSATSTATARARAARRQQVFEETGVLIDGEAAGRMVRRIANEIVERNRGVQGIALVGIRTGGLLLAERLQTLIADIEGQTPPLGAVDISLYRDDIFEGLPRPVIGATELPFDLAGVRVILIDDVLYTGRTVRAALDALMDYGRPRAVELAVLVDRGLRELPIRADYVGMATDTTAAQIVQVQFADDGRVTKVVVGSRPTGGPRSPDQ